MRLIFLPGSSFVCFCSAFTWVPGLKVSATEPWIAALPHWLIFKMLLGPEDGSMRVQHRIATIVAWKLPNALDAQSWTADTSPTARTLLIKCTYNLNYALVYFLRANKAPFIEKQSWVYITCNLWLCLFPPWNFTVKLVWSLVFPCLLLLYTVVLDWNRILGFFFFWAGSWSRQTEPADFLSPTIPQAVCRLCKHTFPPLLFSSACPLAASSSRACSHRIGTHGDTETPTARKLTSSSVGRASVVLSGTPRYFKHFQPRAFESCELSSVYFHCRAIVRH